MIPEILVTLAALGWVLANVIQYLPVSVTEKIPDVVMVGLNLLAAKHGEDMSARTDLKGNRK